MVSERRLYTEKYEFHLVNCLLAFVYAIYLNEWNISSGIFSREACFFALAVSSTSTLRSYDIN